MKHPRSLVIRAALVLVTLAVLLAILPDAALAQIPAAPAAPAPAPAPASAGSLFQVLFGLVVVLGLMAGAAWMLKRFNVARGGVAGAVRIVGGASVGNRERVMVVEVGDQWIVIGVAPGSVNALSTMPKGETPATEAGIAPNEAAAKFSSWLKQKIEQRHGRS